jgi:hypothetical protein
MSFLITSKIKTLTLVLYRQMAKLNKGFFGLCLTPLAHEPQRALV